MIKRRALVAGAVLVVAAGGGGAWVVMNREDPPTAAEKLRDRDAHYRLGYDLQVNQHKPVEAEAEYRKAIDIDPGYDKALYSLAIIRAAANDFDEAIALYRKAIVSNPDFAEAHFNLGLLLRAHGNPSVGQAEIDKGIELKPELGAQLGG